MPIRMVVSHGVYFRHMNMESFSQQNGSEKDVLMFIRDNQEYVGKGFSMDEIRFVANVLDEAKRKNPSMSDEEQKNLTGQALNLRVSSRGFRKEAVIDEKTGSVIGLADSQEGVQELLRKARG